MSWRQIADILNKEHGLKITHGSVHNFFKREQSRREAKRPAPLGFEAVDKSVQRMSDEMRAEREAHPQRTAEEAYAQMERMQTADPGVFDEAFDAARKKKQPAFKVAKPEKLL
jgi:predicted negative regulator of RcsB-dependent stress response